MLGKDFINKIKEEHPLMYKKFSENILNREPTKGFFKENSGVEQSKINGVESMLLFCFCEGAKSLVELMSHKKENPLDSLN